MEIVEELPEELKIYNPLLKDFAYTWFDDKNMGHVYVLRSLEITSLPVPIAKFMAKHLTDKIIMERGIKTNWDDEVENIQKEIFI
jgi:hypothetical protein